MANPPDFIAAWVSGTGAASKVIAIDGRGWPWTHDAALPGAPPSFAHVFLRNNNLHAIDDDDLFWVFNPYTQAWVSGATLELIDAADAGPWKRNKYIRGGYPQE